MLTTTWPSYVNGCRKPLKGLKCSPHQRQRDRSGTMIEKLMQFHWNQVTWPWLKLMPTGGGRKWRTGGRRKHMKWSARLLRASLLPHEEPAAGHSWVLHQNWLVLNTPSEGTPLYTVVWSKWARCTTTTLKEQTPEGSETEEVPQSMNCPSPAQHQTGKSPLGLVNRKLCIHVDIFQSFLAR